LLELVDYSLSAVVKRMSGRPEVILPPAGNFDVLVERAGSLNPLCKKLQSPPCVRV
jgi:hypothetical protein